VLALGRGEPGGRFVKGGESGEVFWQDASGKHPLPAGVRCSQCGCDGENVNVLPTKEVDAMPKGDEFHCIALAPPAPTALPPHGRFLVVEEAPQGEAAGTKQLYWQNATRVLHRVPPGYDCTLCGCSQPVRMAGKVVDDLPEGGDFSCEMIPGWLPILRGALSNKKHGSLAKLAVAGALVLLVAAAVAFCICKGQEQGKQGKQRLTRTIAFEQDEPVVDVDQAASVPLVRSAVPTAYVAPPRYLQQVRYVAQLQEPIVMQPPPRPPPQEPIVMQQPQSMFDMIDKNHDGLITREEWEQGMDVLEGGPHETVHQPVDALEGDYNGCAEDFMAVAHTG